MTGYEVLVLVLLIYVVAALIPRGHTRRCRFLALVGLHQYGETHPGRECACGCHGDPDGPAADPGLPLEPQVKVPLCAAALVDRSTVT